LILQLGWCGSHLPCRFAANTMTMCVTVQRRNRQNPSNGTRVLNSRTYRTAALIPLLSKRVWHSIESNVWATGGEFPIWSHHSPQFNRIGPDIQEWFASQMEESKQMKDQ
jgi:hypothetical protein